LHSDTDTHALTKQTYKERWFEIDAKHRSHQSHQSKIAVEVVESHNLKKVPNSILQCNMFYNLGGAP